MATADPTYQGIPDRLILQAGGRVTRNEFGLDTRTKIYKAKKTKAKALAELAIGSADSDNAGLECVDYEIMEGQVMDEVLLRYKGLLSGTLREPRAENDVALQSTSVLDDGSQSDDGNPQSIGVMYYAPQTTWRWAQYQRPTGAPDFVFVMSADFLITPFNMQPYRGLEHLAYQNVIRVTHFSTAQSGRKYWECQATSSVMLEPRSTPSRAN